MQANKTNAAIQRGIKAARYWKITWSCVKKLDTNCVRWAKSRSLPTWLGHFPIGLAIILSVVMVLIGGLLMGTVVAFIWMAIVGLSSIDDNYIQNEHLKNRSTSSEYRNGDQGYGLYSGPEELITSYRMDKYNDDD